MENRSIGKNLVYQRKRKGYTQEELSERTAVTVRTIQRIEKGDVNPHLQTVKLLATALDIDVADLLPLENPKEEAIQKKWLLLLHGTPLLGFILPFCNVLFPLFLWIHKREDNALYDRHGAKVVNFHITVLILYVLSLVALLTIEKWGFIIFISVIPICVLIVLANIIYAVKSYKCYYPLSIPFLKSKASAMVKSVALLVSILAFTNCTPQKSNTITRLDKSTITSEVLTRKIQKLVDTAKVTGITVSIFNQDTLAYQKAFGFANYDQRDTLRVDKVFYGASLSKSVFGYLVAHLVKDGIIDLDKPLQSYLDTPIPELYFEKEWRGFRNLKDDKRYEDITARMCLSHTTGFPNWRWISMVGELEQDGKIKIYTDPGTRYSYSGEGIRLLQVVIEKIIGQGLEELAREIVFEPLEMHMTSYVWQERFEGKYCLGHTVEQKTIPKDTEDQAGAAGSMETTPIDYSRFLEHILALESQNSPITELLFSPNIEITSKRQFGPQSLETTTENEKIGLNYGMAWGLLTKTPYGKAVFKEGHGEGFQHYSILFPERNIGLLLISNSDNAESIFKELLEVTIGDIYTPWQWEIYIPYDEE